MGLATPREGDSRNPGGGSNGSIGRWSLCPCTSGASARTSGAAGDHAERGRGTEWCAGNGRRAAWVHGNESGDAPGGSGLGVGRYPAYQARTQPPTGHTSYARRRGTVNPSVRRRDAEVPLLAGDRTLARARPLVVATTPQAASFHGRCQRPTRDPGPTVPRCSTYN